MLIISAGSDLGRVWGTERDGRGGWYVKVSADSTIIGMPEYSVEDRVFLQHHSIINLDAFSCGVINVEVLQCIHHSPFACILDDVHGFLHWPEGMALVQEVLGIF